MGINRKKKVKFEPDLWSNTGIDVTNKTCVLHGVIRSATVKKVITAFRLFDELNPAAKGCTFRINSPGGSMSAAYAVHDLFRERAEHVTVHVDEMACSAALVVLAGADYVTCSPSSIFMVHNGTYTTPSDFAGLSSWAAFYKKDRAKMISLLAQCWHHNWTKNRKINGRSNYRPTDRRVQEWTDQERIFEAAEAEAAGLVNKVVFPRKVREFDYGVYDNG